MRPEIELIVAADEEARSHVGFAETRAARDLEAARSAAAVLERQRNAAEREALQRELDAIGAAGEREVAAVRARDEEFLRSAREAGERQLDTAAKLYAHIILHGPEAAP